MACSKPFPPWPGPPPAAAEGLPGGHNEAMASTAPTLKERLRRIRRQDCLEAMDRMVVVQAWINRESVFLSKRLGLWDWSVDGLPAWLVAELQASGLLEI
jgi:hypothetical protein